MVYRNTSRSVVALNVRGLLGDCTDPLVVPSATSLARLGACGNHRPIVFLFPMCSGFRLIILGCARGLGRCGERAFCLRRGHGIECNRYFYTWGAPMRWNHSRPIAWTIAHASTRVG